MSEEHASESWRGEVGRLTGEPLATFLGGGIICRLACLDRDGWPYIVPVWFHYADDGFYVVPRERSLWAQYLKQDPRVSLSIDEATPPYRKVQVKGKAELVHEPTVDGAWVSIATEMSYRYLGEHGPEYLVPTLHEPRWLFFVRPSQMTTWQGVDWATRYKHDPAPA